MRVYNCNGSQYALDAVVPLGLALAWYEGYIPVCTKRSARLLQNKLWIFFYYSMYVSIISVISESVYIGIFSFGLSNVDC